MSESGYTLVTDATGLEACLADLAGEPVLGLDTETTGLDPFTSDVRLVQLATAEHTYVIDCFAFEALSHPRLRAILEADRPVKILHNAKFDTRMLGHHAGVRPRGLFDTYLASQIVATGATGIGHSLAAVVERHLGKTLDKSAQRSDWSGELSESQLAYAAEDSRVLVPLRAKLVEHIKKLSLVEVAKLEFDCAPVVARMENAGIYIDRDRWLALCDVNDRAHKIIRDQLARDFSAYMPQMTLFGEAEINLDSPQQVEDTLHRMGIPVEGTRAMQLQPFARDHQVVARLLEYRGVAKQMSAYGRSMLEHINPKTGRVHPSFMQIGAPSGRFACMEPGVQQIPNTPEYREAIRAPEGRRLVTADYSQIELRILADWSQDAALLNAFRSGEDLHRVTASQMFNVPLDEVTKKQRTAAKSLNFGLLYGMGAQGLSFRIDTTPVEAEVLIRKYFAAYRGVERWLRDAGDRAVRERETRTRSGRLVHFDFDESDRSQVGGIIRLGKNVPIQGCLGPDVRVQTDCGLFRIADLAVRDCANLRVFDGETYVPFHAFPSGRKPAFEVVAADGWRVVSSTDHRFLVATPVGPEWMRTEELRPGMLLMAARATFDGGNDELVPYSYAKAHWRETYHEHRLPDVWTPTLAELVGSLIGDGWYGPSVRRGAMTLAVGEADYDVRDWYVRTWRELFDYDAIVRERAAEGRRRPRSIVGVNSVQIRGFLDAQGLTYDVGASKRIPEAIFRASGAVRAALLRGLFTTDGHVSPDQIPSLRTTAPAVAFGARHLLASLGIWSSIRTFPLESGKTAYRVSVARVDVERFRASVGFRSARKQAALEAPRADTKRRDPAPPWMLREVGTTGLAASGWTPGERAHLRRLALGSGSIASLIKFRDRIESSWTASGLDRVEQYRYVSVLSVEPLGRSIEMFDVEVFDDCHRFVADGFVTHNSSADITKLAMVRLDEALSDIDACLVNTVHDELVVECDEAVADEAKARVADAMESAGREYIKSVPVVVEATISQAWMK